MKPIGELDLELLEGYLDDTLSPARVQQVSQRLQSEPELAATMHELRAMRTLRIAAWRSLAPSEAQAADVAWAVNRFIDKDRRRRAYARTLRVGAAAAAAICVFVTGWFLRAPSKGVMAHETSGVAPVSMVAAQDAAPAFQVTLIDGAGEILPVQRFAKFDDAREFAHDLIQFETRREEAREGGAAMVSDRF